MARSPEPPDWLAAAATRSTVELQCDYRTHRKVIQSSVMRTPKSQIRRIRGCTESSSPVRPARNRISQEAQRDGYLRQARM